MRIVLLLAVSLLACGFERPKPHPHPKPTPTPTASPSVTPTPTPSPSATATPTATPSPTVTPIPTTSPTPTATPTGTPTPTPTRGVTVEVSNPTQGDHYTIYYKDCSTPDYTQLSIPIGQSSIVVPNLTVGKTYCFGNTVDRNGVFSVRSQDIQYTVTQSLQQKIKLHG